MIREQSRGYKVADEVSEVLGCPHYAQNHYFMALRDRVLSPHSTNLIPVSRFYMTLTPPVVVDFEPSPLEGGRFYCEEKRKFCWEHHIVYVPVFLKDSLTRDEFAARVETERKRMVEGHDQAMQDAALHEIRDPRGLLSDPTTQAWIDEQVHQVVQKLKAEGRHLYGMALRHVQQNEKKRIVADLLEDYRRGTLGERIERRESAFATR